MRKLIVLLFVVVCGVQYAGAQSLHVDSTRFITGNNPGTSIHYAIPTADKGILFVGSTIGNPGGIIPHFSTDLVHSNLLVGKIDSNQQIEWIKVYGGTAEDAGGPACQTPDGGYALLAGTTSSNGDITGFKGASDIWLLRLDGAGNLLWEKTYGSSQSDGPISIANTPDHGFVLFGITNGSDGDVPFHYGDFFSMDWLVIKTDSSGNVQWSKDIGGSRDEQNLGTVLVVDSFYYLASASSSNDYNCADTAWHAGVDAYEDYHLLKLDKVGNILWDSSYGGSGSDMLNEAIYDTRDSSIVMIGTTSSSDFMVTGFHGCDDGDMWLLKTNKNGKLEWQKTLGSIQLETGNGICKSHKGGYLVFGTTRPYFCTDSAIADIGFEDCMIFDIDTSGNFVSSKVFGGADVEFSFSIVPYKNGYAATGVSQSSVFTEGTTYGRNSIGQEAFISYIDTGTSWEFTPNQQIKKEIHIYPNPANTVINIALPENETGNVSIYNSMGRVVYSGRRQGHQPLTVAIADWVDGFYFVRWNNDNGAVVTGKFLKM